MDGRIGVVAVLGLDEAVAVGVRDDRAAEGRVIEVLWIVPLRIGGAGGEGEEHEGSGVHGGLLSARAR
ncbi:MAG: hypothetical protein H6739_28355 [Alphaproteobacteria bacterium]|nr:hypothetical protein [Alphaproteobacteria bacterium]